MTNKTVRAIALAMALSLVGLTGCVLAADQICPFGPSTMTGPVSPFPADSGQPANPCPFEPSSTTGPVSPFPDDSSQPANPCPFEPSSTTEPVSPFPDDSGPVLIPICPFTDASGQGASYGAYSSVVPGDPDGDGYYEDLNGNGEIDFQDLLILFEQMDWISENEPVEAFDYNNNGRIDFSDCTALFNKI